MRDLPIIFPISLAILLAAMLFASAYAISANAASDMSGGGASRSASENSVFERGALLVCPFH